MSEGFDYLTEGSLAVWTPLKSRPGHYGHSIATEPLLVKVLTRPCSLGRTKVHVEDPKARKILGAQHYVKVGSLKRMS